MRKLLDYKIVCGSHVEEVEKSVRDHIGAGWELLGPAYCCQDRHCQTIVKHKVPGSGTPSAEIPSTHQVHEVRRGFDGPSATARSHKAWDSKASLANGSTCCPCTSDATDCAMGSQVFLAMGPELTPDGFRSSIALAAEIAVPVVKSGATKTKTKTIIRVATNQHTLKASTRANRNNSKNKSDNQNWSGDQPYTKSRPGISEAMQHNESSIHPAKDTP